MFAKGCIVSSIYQSASMGALVATGRANEGLFHRTINESTHLISLLANGREEPNSRARTDSNICNSIRTINPSNRKNPKDLV